MNRRSFLIGIGSALAAPAIVRADNIMKIAVLRETVQPTYRLVATYGALWTADGRKAGSWHIENGRVSFSYVNPDANHNSDIAPANGVWSLSASNTDASTAMDAMSRIGVQSYPPLVGIAT